MLGWVRTAEPSVGVRHVEPESLQSANPFPLQASLALEVCPVLWASLELKEPQVSVPEGQMQRVCCF